MNTFAIECNYSVIYLASVTKISFIIQTPDVPEAMVDLAAEHWAVQRVLSRAHGFQQQKCLC